MFSLFSWSHQVRVSATGFIAPPHGGPRNINHLTLLRKQSKCFKLMACVPKTHGFVRHRSTKQWECQDALRDSPKHWPKIVISMLLLVNFFMATIDSKGLGMQLIGNPMILAIFCKHIPEFLASYLISLCHKGQQPTITSISFEIRVASQVIFTVFFELYSMQKCLESCTVQVLFLLVICCLYQSNAKPIHNAGVNEFEPSVNHEI